MGMLEFFYDQAPDDMQSIGTSLFLSNTGVAHFFCSAIVIILGQVTGRGGKQNWIQPNTNQSRLDKYYWLLAVMAAINCVLFFIAAHWYTYKQSTRLSNEKLIKVAPSEAPVPE
jgi:hypothetical protein